MSEGTVTRAHSWAMMASHFNVFVAFILFMFILIANAMGFTMSLIHPDYENDIENQYFALTNYGNQNSVFVLVNVYSVISLLIPIYIWKKVWKGSKKYVVLGLILEIFIIIIMIVYCAYHYMLFESSQVIITIFSFYFFSYKLPVILISACYTFESCGKILGFDMTKQRINVIALRRLDIDVEEDENDN